MKIRVGTRDSKLAMIQTEIVVEYIKQYDSSIEIEMIPMKTTGDKILDITLDKIGGKGLFVKELDEALLMNHVDITVHSFKDMPMEENVDLPIVAVSEREDPRDVLIVRQAADGSRIAITKDMVIGTSSKRRELQLKRLGYHNIKSIRGNIFTRLQKLDAGEFDAIVLAAAGVKRGGIQERISKYFTVEEMIPSACQGNLVVQGKLGKDYSYLQGLHNEQAAMVAQAERAFVRSLDGGCSTPTAAYGKLEGDTLTLKGLFLQEDNRVSIQEISGKCEEAITLGCELANRILHE